MAAARPETLAEVEASVWHELAQAVRDKHHGWRVAVLATVDGPAADARSVVLRDLDAPSRTLLMYTDARSPKAETFDVIVLGVVMPPGLAV